ncbi:MAG: DUF2065 family protein [Rhodanobacter sp.]
MLHELALAFCLVLIIEGLVLFAMPRGWQAMVREALKLAPQRLRLFGAGAVLVGLLLLRWLH